MPSGELNSCDDLARYRESLKWLIRVVPLPRSPSLDIDYSRPIHPILRVKIFDVTHESSRLDTTHQTTSPATLTTLKSASSVAAGFTEIIMPSQSNLNQRNNFPWAKWLPWIVLTIVAVVGYFARAQWLPTAKELPRKIHTEWINPLKLYS